MTILVFIIARQDWTVLWKLTSAACVRFFVHYHVDLMWEKVGFDVVQEGERKKMSVQMTTVALKVAACQQ